MTSSTALRSWHQRARLTQLLLLALVAVALTGCPSTGGTRESASELATATRHLQRGRFADAAAAFERLAARERGEARDALLLDATRAWLEAGQLTRALGALDNLAGEPPQSDRAVALLQGYRALRDGRPDAALDTLDSLRPTLPARYLGLWHELRGRAFFQSGDVVRGVTSLVERELWLERGQDIDANREIIWRALQAIGEKGASFAAPDGTDPVTAGWLELAAANASGALNPLGKFAALRDWREAHPDHPGAFIVDRMSEARPMSFGYPDTVAVLLPLSGRFAGTAAAVRDGLMAAYLADGERIGRPALRFYDTGSEDAVSLLQRAAEDGATLAIGPLLKTQVEAVAAASPNLPVLALNTAGEGAPYAPSVFQFSLAPEHEAAAVAERAIAEGHSRAVALVPNSAWGERLLNAFGARLQSLGGQLLSYQTYEAADSDFAVPITSLLHLNESRERWRQVSAATGLQLEFEPRRRGDVEFVFVATDARQGRLIRPAFQYHFAEDLPIYATSAAYEDDAEANGRDLDGLVFADMPWVINERSDAGDVRRAFARHWPSRVLRRDRLYAMGYDAYRLIPQLVARDAWVTPWPGVTGQLSLGPGGRIKRGLQVAQIRNGTAVPLDPIVEPGYFDAFETQTPANSPVAGDDGAETSVAPSTPE